MRRKMIEDIAAGCLPVATGFALGMLLCLLISLCSCRPQQRIIEVEKWRHDTVSVKDTVHVKDIVVTHDSVYITDTIEETVHDTVTNDVAWRYLTFDGTGNITSLLDYTSNVTQGRTAQKSHESAHKSVSDKGVAHEEKASHSESMGSTTQEKSKEEIKPQLSRWQQFIQFLGYIMLLALGVGTAFAILRLCGKYNKI